MPNKFLGAVNRAVLRHGKEFVYTRVIRGTFDVSENIVPITEQLSDVLMYKKHIQTTQFNFPNLVGKEVAMFYIPGDAIAFKPAIKDKITDGSITYVIDSIQETIALNAIVLYRLVCVKS